MHKITYNPQFEQPMPRKAAISFNGMRLKPGVTEVSDSQLISLRNNEGFQRREQIGAIRVESEQVKKEDPKPSLTPPNPPPTDIAPDEGLTSLNITEAAAKIKATNDLPTLEKWVEVETAGKNRKMVLESLDEQINKLKEADS